MSGGEGSIHDRLEAFFNQLEQLASHSQDATLRRVVLGNAVALSDQFGEVAGELGRIRARLDIEIENVVREIGPIASQIAELNVAIQRSEVRGISANDLRDQRDQLINELSERVGVRVIEQDYGQTTILLGGAPLVVGNTAVALETGFDDQGQPIITLAGFDEPLAISGGKVGGLLQVRNQSLPDLESRVNAIAHELIERIDKLHATGLGLGGPMTIVSGNRAASSVTAPLANAELAFPPQAGSLFITVTNLATGQRTLHEVAVDPETQSLADVAAAINGVGNIQAIADPQTRSLTILAAAGYAFDFAGRLEASPATAGITGSTVPAIGGVYTGSQNDQFTYRVVGSGTIGVTPNLTLEVKNYAGTIVASLAIGQGYEPGSALQVADGVTLRLSAGSANNNDTFSTRVIADADTSGLLAALGLNSFFTGHDANDIRVRTELISDPNLLAASVSGQPGDGLNLRRMAAVRDLPLLGDGKQTLSQAYVAMVGDVGLRVQALDQLQTNQTVIGERLEAERQSISGVDANEELIRLVEFQRAFQLASRYINAVNEALDELYRII